MKYAFDNASLIDGTQDMRVQPGLCVLTDGETITDIVPAGTAPDGYRRIDLHGRYLLPGLINMHVHLAGNGKIQKKQRDLETLVRRTLEHGGRAAAICAAPSVLAQYGLLAGRRATCYPGFEDRCTGAQMVDADVVTDGQITTGRALGAAIPFALELVRLLTDEQTAARTAEEIVYRA